MVDGPAESNSFVGFEDYSYQYNWEYKLHGDTQALTASSGLRKASCTATKDEYPGVSFCSAPNYLMTLYAVIAS